MGKLSDRRQAFVNEYLKDFNASQSAVRAGYKGDPNTVGPRLLADVGVAAAIAQAVAERSKRTKIDADFVLTRLAELADADIADLYDDGGALKPLKDWPKAFRKGLVAGLETEREEAGDGGGSAVLVVRKVKLADRVKILELIGKHVNVKAFIDKLEVEAGAGLAEAIIAARKRIAK